MWPEEEEEVGSQKPYAHYEREIESLAAFFFNIYFSHFLVYSVIFSMGFV